MSNLQKVTLKPGDGLTIRDPETLQFLSEAGEIKPLSAYWLRRLAEGDVVEVEAVPSPAKKSEKQTDNNDSKKGE